MRRKKIIRSLLITLSVVLGALVFLSVTGTIAHAAGLVDNTVSDANAYSKYPLCGFKLGLAPMELAGWDWKKYSVRFICNHQLCLDGEPLYLQRHRLCGTGGLQAGFYF